MSHAIFLFKVAAKDGKDALWQVEEAMDTYGDDNNYYTLINALGQDGTSVTAKRADHARWQPLGGYAEAEKRARRTISQEILKVARPLGLTVTADEEAAVIVQRIMQWGASHWVEADWHQRWAVLRVLKPLSDEEYPWLHPYHCCFYDWRLFNLSCGEETNYIVAADIHT